MFTGRVTGFLTVSGAHSDREARTAWRQLGAAPTGLLDSRGYRTASRRNNVRPWVPARTGRRRA